jgi:hypothetical protein
MLKTVSTSLLREGDEVAVRSTGYSQIHQEATVDRQLLAAAIARFAGAGLTDAEIKQGGAVAGDEVKSRAATTSTVAQELLAELRADRPRVLLCFSEDEISPVVSAAGRQAGVAIYGIDPRKFIDAPAEFDKLVSRINAEVR